MPTHRSPHSRLAAASVITLAVTAVAFLLAEKTPWGRYLELKSYDLRMQFRGRTTGEQKIAIIYIDKRSLEEIQDPLIFWHPFYGKIFKALAESGARAVGFDVTFEIPVRRWNERFDQEIAEDYLKATEGSMPIVVAIHSNQNRVSLPFYLAALNQEQFGFIDLKGDEDQIIRRQRLMKDSEDSEDIPSFALRIAALSTAVTIDRRDGRLLLGNEPIPLESGDYLRISFQKRPHRISRFSFQEVLRRASVADKEYFGQRFKNKIVLIGVEDPVDLHTASITSEAGSQRTPGVEIHAQSIFTLLDRDFIRTAPPGFALTITAALVALLTFLSFRGGPWTGLVFSLVFICTVLVAGIAALRLNYHLALMQPLFGIPLSYAAVFAYRFRMEFRNRWRIQRIFGQYLPEPIVRQIADSWAEEQVLGGTRQHITVLFSDIRDFTTLTERLKPEALIPQLNEYLSAMTDVVLAHNGIVDKFIGDGILALFGTPLSREDHAASAVQAGVGMIEKLELLNKKWEEKGWPALKIGIGIHTGDAIVGNIGSSRKMEYTALGDTVNVASRVEGKTKDYGILLLMTDTTAGCLDGRWNAERVGSELLKGKTESTTLYALRSMIPH